jgi:hypothetical protein
MSTNIITDDSVAFATLRPYKAYMAALSHANSSANPSAIEFENQIGAQGWERMNPGFYQMRVDAFDVSKIYLPMFGNWQGNSQPYMPLHDGGQIVGWYTLQPSTSTVDDIVYQTILLEVRNAAGVSTDLFDLLGATTIYLPEVRVYP